MLSGNLSPLFLTALCAPSRLFLHPDRVTGELRKYLNASCAGPLCVQLKDYDKVLEELKKYVAQPDIKVWVGTEYTNYALYEIIKPMVCTDIFKMIFVFDDAFFLLLFPASYKELAYIFAVTGPVNLT